MNIDELPIEMLMKIFSYLNREEQVTLVNKHFYNVWCQAKVGVIRLSHLVRVSNISLLLFNSSETSMISTGT